MNPASTVTLNSGNAMPILGLGTWQLSHDTPGAIESALKMGYHMIDTSGDYGTQPGISEGIKRSGVNRDDFYLVTKVEETDQAYDAVVKNLGELQLDYADLVLIHRPPWMGVGEELWHGLIQARDDGLARDIGVSNYSVDQIQELSEISDEVPAVNQIEWSPFGYSDAMLKYCQGIGTIIQAYSPLTRGKRLDDPNLRSIAIKYGKTPTQIVIRWNIQTGTVPIVKANQKYHQQENLDVFDFDLSNEDMKALDDLNENYSSLGSHLMYE